MATPDQIICTRAFLRGGLTQVERIERQLVDGSLLHAGGDLLHAEDNLNAARVMAGQLVILLDQAAQALAIEAQQPTQSEDVAA